MPYERRTPHWHFAFRGSGLIVVYSQYPHCLDDLLLLRDSGVTHVCYAVVSRHTDWQKTATMVKSLGMKLVAALPDWCGIDFDHKCFQFHVKNGRASRSIAECYGPSYWAWLAEYDAMHHPFMQEVAQTLDAVIVAPRWGDVPFPTEWSAAHLFDFTYPRMYWSFDPWARRAWAKYSDAEMPEFATCDLEGNPERLDFYQWYQAAWQKRVYKFSEWAMGFGIKDIWTWMVPFNEWTTENMAWGTAGSFPLLDKWANWVEDRGCKPCFVLACLWSIWPGRKSGSIDNARRFIEAYKWDVVVGTEACQSTEALAVNLETLGAHTRGIGARGVFASDRYIIQPDNQLKAKAALRMEAVRWRDHLAESE